MSDMSVQNALGLLSIAIAVVAYARYFQQIFSKSGVEPHPFSWLPWG
jgi:hypothetical protein